jgi:hypothetical protein
MTDPILENEVYPIPGASDPLAVVAATPLDALPVTVRTRRWLAIKAIDGADAVKAEFQLFVDETDPTSAVIVVHGLNLRVIEG